MENKKELGIYIHIPFCIKKCNYCDFLSAPATQQVQNYYVNSLLGQIQQYKEKIQQYEVKTIFFGGGTPSILETCQLERIITVLKDIGILIEEVQEISLEANPGTLSLEKLTAYKKMGFNRLSIGLQATEDEELKLLGRIHTYNEFLQNYFDARECGFQNINIDLMTGLPEQTLKKAENSLKKIIKLSPEHISAYSLIIEEGTKFYEWYYGNKSSLPDEDTERNIYYMTKQLLQDNGYYRYEISNYAKFGYESKHNLIYWSGMDYIGFGLGAASYLDGVRFTMEDDLDRFCEEGQKGNCLERDKMILTKKEKIEEFMFLGLRKIAGIKKQDFALEFHCSIEEIYGSILKKLSIEGLLVNEGEQIYLTEYGIDVSNRVLSEFLLD